MNETIRESVKLKKRQWWRTRQPHESSGKQNSMNETIRERVKLKTVNGEEQDKLVKAAVNKVVWMKQ